MRWPAIVGFGKLSLSRSTSKKTTFLWTWKQAKCERVFDVNIAFFDFCVFTLDQI